MSLCPTLQCLHVHLVRLLIVHFFRVNLARFCCPLARVPVRARSLGIVLWRHLLSQIYRFVIVPGAVSIRDNREALSLREDGFPFSA